MYKHENWRKHCIYLAFSLFIKIAKQLLEFELLFRNFYVTSWYATVVRFLQKAVLWR